MTIRICSITAGCASEYFIDIGWDMEMLDKYPNAELYGFDWTPKSRTHVEAEIQKLRLEHREGDGSKRKRFHYTPEFMSWSWNGTIKVALPKDPTHVSASTTLVNKAQSAEGSDASQHGGILELPSNNLDTWMRRHGHDKVNLMKLDIEGAEYDVLERLVGEVESYEADKWSGGADVLPALLRVEQLLIEFHLILLPDRNSVTGASWKNRQHGLIQRLLAVGFLPFYCTGSQDAQELFLLNTNGTPGDGGGGGVHASKSKSNSKKLSVSLHDSARFLQLKETRKCMRQLAGQGRHFKLWL